MLHTREANQYLVPISVFSLLCFPVKNVFNLHYRYKQNQDDVNQSTVKTANKECHLYNSKTSYTVLLGETDSK